MPSNLPSFVLAFHGCDQRALEYATLLKEYPRKSGPKVRNPAVVGAVIDPGYCLNLLDAKFLGLVREGYTAFATVSGKSGVPLPTNKAVGTHRELLLRDLDCAVINTVHRTRAEENLPPFDTVRAAFIEGQPLYPGSGFFDRNHIQICVRNRRCIKAYFRPLEEEAAGAGEP